jgi:hypothetical protein
LEFTFAVDPENKSLTPRKKKKAIRAIVIKEEIPPTKLLASL